MGKLIGHELDKVIADVALAMLVTDGWIGGPRGASAVREALTAGAARIAQEQSARQLAETALEFAQASIRAFIGDGPVPIAEPPAGHEWRTAAEDSTGPRLYCVTCPVRPVLGDPEAEFARYTFRLRATSAAECLAASR